MTQSTYLALLDTLYRATQLEDEKAKQGPEAMAAWARVAVPRWQAVSTQLAAAELAQPLETAAWYTVWRDEQHRAGRWRYPGVEGPETGQGDDLTGQGAISPWPAGSSRDLGASAARTRDAAIRTHAPDRAILPAAQMGFPTP